MTRVTPVWWHPRWRVQVAAAGSVLLAAAAVVLFLRGDRSTAAVLVWLLVVTVTLQARPWFYARLKAPQVVLRVATVVFFVVPCLTIATVAVASPNHRLSLGLGLAAGAVFVAVHARDSRLLLDPGIVAIQPRMSTAGALSRFLYVLVVVPLEEYFYRKLIIDGFSIHAGIFVAVAISVLAFVYGDWSGSWGPASSAKRLYSEIGLAVATASVYAATGSLAGPLVTHYLYNGPQLALPPINLYIHRRSTQLLERP